MDSVYQFKVQIYCLYIDIFIILYFIHPAFSNAHHQIIVIIATTVGFLFIFYFYLILNNNFFQTNVSLKRYDCAYPYNDHLFSSRAYSLFLPNVAFFCPSLKCSSDRYQVT